MKKKLFLVSSSYMRAYICLNASGTHGLIAQFVRASERNSVLVGSDILEAMATSKCLSAVNTIDIYIYIYKDIYIYT